MHCTRCKMPKQALPISLVCLYIGGIISILDNSVKLHIFNPENDLALADGGANYCPTPAAMHIARDLASLPLWFADAGDKVVIPNEVHKEYHERISRLFSVASPYENNMHNDITSCVPWGWSPQIKRRLNVIGFGTLLPSDESMARIRELSNRKTSITILKALQELGIDTPPLPLYCTNPDDVANFVNSRPRCVVKAPWSGSGKGIMWGIGRVETPMENFYKGVIRRQGGVVCEEFLNGKVEFAMEFCAKEGTISFSGYSLFNSFKGSYTGNILAPDSEIEKYLAQFIPLHELHMVREELINILQSMNIAECYTGYLGIDMMIYEDCGKLRLNPCMELNLRMNMGMASRLFYDRHVVPGKRGEFFVDFHKKDGEALALHEKYLNEYPLALNDGKIESGYLNLTPITAKSRYSAYAIINE